MLQNVQDVVGKAAELPAQRILCAFRMKGKTTRSPKHKKIKVSLLLDKSLFRNSVVCKKKKKNHKISFLKYNSVVKKRENKDGRNHEIVAFFFF